MIGQGGGGLSSLGRGRYQHVFFVIDFMEIMKGEAMKLRETVSW